MSRYYDPTAGTRTVAFRWWLASLLNRLPNTCWPSLVSWALGNRRLVDLSGNQDDVRVNSLCAIDVECGRCYCGKRAETPTPVASATDTTGAGDV